MAKSGSRKTRIRVLHVWVLLGGICAVALVGCQGDAARGFNITVHVLVILAFFVWWMMHFYVLACPHCGKNMIETGERRGFLWRNREMLCPECHFHFTSIGRVTKRNRPRLLIVSATCLFAAYMLIRLLYWDQYVALLQSIR